MQRNIKFGLFKINSTVQDCKNTRRLHISLLIIILLSWIIDVIGSSNRNNTGYVLPHLSSILANLRIFVLLRNVIIKLYI